jgi:rod shape-determining protein MreC
MANRVEKVSEDNALLRRRVQELSVLEHENQRLRDLLHMSRKIPQQQVKIAQPLRVERREQNGLVHLNMGTADGVFLGQAALDSEGLLGQVVHVAQHTSMILLVNADNHIAPVQISRNGFRSSAVGQGVNAPLDVVRIPVETDIKTDDLLVTSGAGGIFAKGYPVARVSQIVQGSQMFMDVLATPLARTDQIHEVMLVWPAKPEEQQP